MIVTCVTCEQVLVGGQCTNEMCPGSVPIEDEEKADLQAQVERLRGGLESIRHECERQVEGNFGGQRPARVLFEIAELARALLEKEA